MMRAAGIAARMPISVVNKRDWQRQSYSRQNERPIEYRFVFERLTADSPTTVLDVGPGESALPAVMRACGFLVTAIDNITDFWPDGFVNRHYHVVDDDIRNPRIEGRFDFVSCLSVLEHIEESEEAVRHMFDLLNPGGSLVMTFPYNEDEYVPNAYELQDAGYGHDAPYVCQIYDRARLDGWLELTGAELEAQEHWQVFSGSHWTVGETLRPPRRVTARDRHHLTCVSLRRP